jgi:hypothetical protein
MVESVHEGDDKDFLFQHKNASSKKLLHIPPKLWPPIISKH